MKYLIIIVLSVLSAAQAIQVTDETTTGPLSFNAAEVGSPMCTVTAVNHDGRTVVAWYIEMLSSNLDGTPHKATIGHDHFFVNDPIMDSDKQFDMKFFCDRLDKKSIRVKLRFVQFSDGGYWGDQEMVNLFRFQRQDATNYLKAVQTGTDPAQEVDTYTANHVFRGEVLNRRQALLDKQKKDGPQSLAAEISTKLAIAQKHANWIK